MYIQNVLKGNKWCKSEKSVGVTILIAVYKSESESVLQLWGKKKRQSFSLQKYDIKVLKCTALWRCKCENNKKC